MRTVLFRLVGALLLFAFLAGCKKPSLKNQNGVIEWSLLEERLDGGLSPNTYVDDKPLLSWAAYSGNAEAVALLLRRGADIRSGTHSLSRPALFVAADSGNIKIATLLLDAGMDPNVPDMVGIRPLRNAAVCKRLKMVEFLLSRGADPGAKDTRGQTVVEQVKGITTPEILALLEAKK